MPIILLPDKPCKKCSNQMRPVFFLGRIIRWTCDWCSPPPKSVWTKEE